MQRRVAVIGQSFRFPGTQSTSYWTDLLAGRDLVSRIDSSRFPPDSFLHPDPRHPGTSYSFAAGVIDHVGDFDAGFFGISPREAALIDPQQRLLLELAWEALENAGIPPRSLRASKTGVFIGIASADYSYRLIDDLAAIDAPAATGNAGSIAANRLSWFFDFRGPSMAIDTACSSAMVAFHQACRAIQNGECAQALAGGVSLLLHPYVFVSFAKATMLSKQGRCRVFDASADGYVRAEGGGVLVLKDLEQALADGDPVLAVVAGSGVNADGYTQGLTVPNAAAQAALLAEVYAAAGIDPEEIDYLEAHGTGTVVGDPIETRAISAALARHRSPGRPLPIGSVKSNMGHLEAASGIAGLVKAVHCLTQRVVPATIGVVQINPHIPTAEWNLEIVTRNRPLPAEGRLVVGVNSFGFGGANAHVVLSSFEGRKPAVSAVPVKSVPLVLSGHDEAALRANAAQLAEVLAQTPALKLQNVAYQLNYRRDWLPQRLLVQGNASQVVRALRSYSEGQETELDLVTGSALAAPAKLAFVYAGNGAQWEGMGRRLLATSPFFREAVDEVDSLFRVWAGFSILDELLGLPGENRYAATEIAQPALFAVQVGVTRLLRQQGVMPDAVLGHSVGEIAAAWAAGALSLEAAVRVVYERSRLQGATRGTGAMTAVGLSATAAQELIDSLALPAQLAVAAANSANDCTLAGTTAALATVEAALAELSVFYRRLDLDYAFHSVHMDGLEAPLHTALGCLAPTATTLPFYSTVTGAALPGTALDADYWWQNIRRPVAFEAAVAAAQADGINVWLELGPHPVLGAYLRRAAGTGLVLASLSRRDDAASAVWRAGAQAIVAGATPDWSGFFPRPRPPLALPNYAWQRKRYWHPVTPATLGLLGRYARHPLLGYPLPQHPDVWENTLDIARLPVLAAHAVGETPVLPAAGFAELALTVAQERQTGEWLRVCNLEIRAPLTLGADSTRLLRTSLLARERSLSVQSRPELANTEWLLHCQAELPADGLPPVVMPAPPVLPARPADFDAASHYAQTARLNVQYGPAFQRVAQGWTDPHTVLATLHADPADAAYTLSPMALDAAFQLILPLAAAGQEPDAPRPYLPVRIGRVIARRAGGPAHLIRARLGQLSARNLRASFELFDAQGQLLALIEDVNFRRMPAAQDPRPPRHLAWRWEALPPAQPARAGGNLYPALAARLARLGEQASVDAFRAAYVNEVEPLLDRLCSAYLHQALLGLADANGLISTEQAPALPHWWRSLLAEAEADGLVTATPAGWQLLLPAAPLASSIEAIVGSLVAEHPVWFELVLLVARTGQALPALLKGELAFAGLHARGLSRAALLERVRGVAGRAQLGRALNALRELPAEAAPARVLEIAERLPLLLSEAGEVPLAERGRYRFASAAARTLALADARWPWLQTRCIDPTAVAAATEDCELVLLRDDAAGPAAMAAMLATARASLAPGGALLVLGQQPTRWLSWVFGPDAESTGAGLEQRSLEAWRQILQAQGFGAPHAFWLDGEAVAGSWVLLATAPERPVVPAQPAPTGRRLLLVADDDREPLVHALRETLRSQGAVVSLITAPSPETLLARMAGLAELDGAVLLAGLAPLATGPRAASDELAAQTRRCALATALVQGMEDCAPQPTCWLITRNAFGDHGLGVADAALWGFGRSLMNECERTELRLVELGDLPEARAAVALAAELLNPADETELRFTAEGTRLAPRLSLYEPSQPVAATSGPTSLVSTQPGSLEHLVWRRQPPVTLADDEVEITVAASALNFRDVMLAVGLLPPEAVDQGFAGPNLGLEFAGTVSRVGRAEITLRPGDRVMGYGPSSFADRVITKRWALVPVPPQLPLAAAATIPTAFLTAWYSLVHLARLRAGEKVLIHGAAGGVGLAAIQIAHALGAEVFATAGAEDKRDFLRLMGVRQVFDSRTLRFADHILHATDGAGVDVVLNSLSGEAIARSLDVLKPFGRFIELGKRDFFENTRVGLRPFRNNLSYFGVDVDQLMRDQPALARELLAEVAARFADDSFLPLPYREFTPAQMVEAFRHMQGARHIGKLVISYPQGVPAARGRARPLRLRHNARYLVTGGLSGFGLACASWLVAQGARHLVLLSRRGEADAAATAGLAALTASGATVQTLACDISLSGAVEALFTAAEADGLPIGGVVHAAAHYDDGLARTQTPAQIRAVLAPKLAGALNLHAATATRPMDFFVLLSSATTLFGNPGQSAYVAANHALESLAQARRAAGLPATCVLLGPIEDTGYLARHGAVQGALTARLGGRALAPQEALAALGSLLSAEASGSALLHFHWSSLARLLRPAGQARFAELARVDGTQPAAAPTQEEARRALLCLSDSALREQVIQTLKQALGGVLNVDPQEIDPAAPVYSLGLDSLMGVELAVSIDSSFGVHLPEMGLGEQSLVQLAARIVEQLRRELAPEEQADATADAEEAQLAFLSKHEARPAAARILKQ